MSRFSGKHGKGAMKAHRDERYRAAVGRQQRLWDKGMYHRESDVPGVGIVTCTPVDPVELMRPVDRLYPCDDPRVDFRHHARKARR